MNRRSTHSPNGRDGDARAVLDSIRRIVQALHVSSREAERRVGLSGAKLFVLQKLQDGGAQSLNDLANRTLTHQSSVSVVVQNLVARGLVERVRSHDDARRVELSLTSAGRRLARSAPEPLQERLFEALTRMPRGQRKRMAASLNRLIDEMDLNKASGAPMLFEDGHVLPKSHRRRRARKN